MNRLWIRAALCTVALSLLSALSFAGVVIEYEMKSAGDGKEPRKNTLWIEKDRVRAETGGGGFIFRGDKQTLFVLQEKDGKYMEITKEQMQKMGAQMSDAMAKIQEELKSLPPEQRKMMEQMLAGKMPGTGEQKKLEPRSFKKTGKSETLNGFPCTSYDGMRGEKREQELWVTGWKQIELAPADLKVLGDMAAFLKDMVGPLGKQMSNGFVQAYSETDKGDAVPGLPVRTITFSDRGDTIIDLKKVAHETIPAAKFEIPEGLKKESMPL